jgi:alpha-amylase
VQNCDLLGLPDLNTGTNYVQERTAKFINDMYDLGVTGVRIDAAKHIDAGQLQGIMSRVNSNMYVFTEVIDGPGEPITPSEYFGIGDVTEFNFGRRLKDIFASGNLGDLGNFGEAFGLMPSDKAVTFIENHDTEREYPFNYKNGRTYELSVVFALAHPYGYPKVMSGYNFNSFDQGPPPPNTAYDRCFDTWTCQHRWSPIGNMVGFRNAAIGQGVNNFYSEGSDRISFSRGNVGFVAINRNGGTWSTCRQTGLPAGSYRNVIESGNEMIQVQGDGTACFDVANFRAVAFYVGA